MSKRKTYKDTPHNPSELYREILAGIPGLDPLDMGDVIPGVGAVLRAQVIISSHGDDVTIEVPDWVDFTVLDAIVAGHTNPPGPPPPVRPNFGNEGQGDIADKAADYVDKLRTYKALTNPTALQRKNFEDGVIEILIYLIRRSIGG